MHFLVPILQFIFFLPKRHKKLRSKLVKNSLGRAGSSIANRPKTSPNVKFCSIKMAHRATFMYNGFGYDRVFEEYFIPCMHFKQPMNTAIEV